MSPRRKFSRAGGAFFAAALIIGALGGLLAGQPSMGILAGAGVGMALLAAVWLTDRAR